MGTSGEPAGGPGALRGWLASLGPGIPSSTAPRGAPVPRGAGRPPPRRIRVLAAPRDPRVRDAVARGAKRRRLGAGSFRGSQEAGVAFGPPREREGRRDRGRVPLSAGQRLRQGGLPGADGISAQRPAEAWLRFVSGAELESEKASKR